MRAIDEINDCKTDMTSQGIEHGRTHPDPRTCRPLSMSANRNERPFLSHFLALGPTLVCSLLFHLSNAHSLCAPKICVLQTDSRSCLQGDHV